MTKYVALLRGIGPGSPNMRNEKLRATAENAGLSNVSTVISSGNVIFESPESDTAKLEKLLETAWSEQLGFTSTTIVRSQKQLAALAASRPFDGFDDLPKSRLHVTFVKNKPSHSLPLPYYDTSKLYRVLAFHHKAVYSVVDSTSQKAPNLMQWLEKQYGTAITTRSWRTVQLIMRRME
jgi:uncharacterized protein (DUF1697 family)